MAEAQGAARLRTRTQGQIRRPGIDLVFAAVIVAYGALYLGWQVFRWGGADMQLAIADATQIPLDVLGTSYALLAARRGQTTGVRRAWLVIGLALAAYTSGDVAWFCLEVVVRTRPYPSIADVGYLAFYPLLLLGLLAIPKGRPDNRSRTALDLAIVVVGASAIVWWLVLEPIARTGANRWVETLLALAYPVGDLLVIFAVAATLTRRLVGTSRWALALLGIGLGLNVVADLAYARLSIDATYQSGAWLDACYLVGWMSLGLAGFVQARHQVVVHQELIASGPTKLASFLSYLAVAGVFGLLLIAAQAQGFNLAVLTAGAITVTALVVIRQVLTARENTQLTKDRASLLESMPDQILRFDDVGRYLGAVSAPTPGSPFTDDVLGMTLEEILPAPLAKLCRDTLDRAVATKASAEISYSNDRADGRHHFETRVIPMGRGGLAIIRDVTSTRRAAADRERLAQILDATPDIVCSVDSDGIVSYENDAFRRLLSVRIDERPAHIDSVLKAFPDVLRVFHETAVPQALRYGFWRGDIDFVSAEVNQPISMIAVAHGNPGESSRQISIVGRDIRQQRQNDQALRDAKEAADAANRAKGDFLATMSHEIRTPMNGIIGSTELLLASGVTEGQLVLAGALRDSSEALLAIIDDVLDLSKIEANSLELESIPFDLHALIDSVAGVLGPAAERKNLELLVSLDPGIPRWLVGDPGRLRQVLINLAGNAVKFTDRGTVVVSVAMLGLIDRGNARLVFEVRDTGIGISPDARSRLFKSFSQADNSMSRRFGGTGLGLAISWRLVDRMGGLLDVSSRVGEGSTFSFTIELPTDTETNLDIAHQPPDAAPILAGAVAPANVMSDVRLLLVEDNEINRQVVGAMLGCLGIDPTGMASDGFEAVAAADATKFDLILMDCQMPGMDGFEATRKIRSTETGGHHVPIVALTANATAEDRRRCLSAGMDDYMPKPVRLANLRETLERWLAPAAASAASPMLPASPIAESPPVTSSEAMGPQARAGRVLDEETLASLRSLGIGDQDVLGPLIDLFQREAAGHLAAIESAVERTDAEALGRVAHTLKGASRNLGAIVVGDIAAELESRARSGSASEAELVAELRSAVATTMTAFEDERRRPAAAGEGVWPSPISSEIIDPQAMADIRVGAALDATALAFATQATDYQRTVDPKRGADSSPHGHKRGERP